MARLNREMVERAKSTIALYPQKRSALLPLLHLAQEQDGWLTPDAMEHVGELLDLDPAEVIGTAAFYTMFKRQPTGKHLISICTNLACMLAGAYELLEHAESRLGIKPGGTTADGAFSLEEAECLAHCDQAPCLQVNYRYFDRVGNTEFDALIEDLKAGRRQSDIPPHGTLSRVRRTAPALGAAVRHGGDAKPEPVAPPEPAKPDSAPAGARRAKKAR